MKKKLGLIVAALVVALSTLVGGVWSSRRLSARAVTTSEQTRPIVDPQIERDYNEAMDLVSGNYADEIDYEKASQAAIQGMLWTLDPHSSFFTRAEFERLKQDQDSEFYGIGVSILRHRDGVYVQSPVANTPASRAGLRYGDRILEVDGKDARDWTSEQVSKAVRGERGEPVTLKIERPGALAPLYFSIVRGPVPLPSIRTAFVIRPGTGYIALAGGFTHTTGDELEEAVAALQKQGMRQLVLDLRNNPGGLLQESIKVASQFLPRGQTIVAVRGRGENGQTQIYKNTDYDPEEFPLVVLLNRNSASASEIVAGAIQDHGRGLLIGETSFGKGLVQRVFQLPYGTGLTLTTQKYYTPYGRSIQRDYSSGSLYDYYVRQDPNEQPQPQQPRAPTLPTQHNVNAALPNPTPVPTPPPPAGPAVKTAAGRVFYGGGGITPDIEVKPLDVAAPERGRIFEAAFYFTRQLAAGQIPGLEQYRIDQPRFDHAPTAATEFPVTERVVEAFRNFVRRDPEQNLTVAQLDADLDYAKMRLREEITTAAYGNEAGARTLLDYDPQLLRALEAFPDAKRLAESVRSGVRISQDYNNDGPRRRIRRIAHMPEPLLT